MNFTRNSEIEQDFQLREQNRHREFAPVWDETLEAVFADVAPYYDIASDVASLGLCSAWRRRFTRAIGVGAGDRVLDVCAGTNGVGIALLARQPDIKVTAIDRSAAMQAEGGRRAKARGFSIESHVDDVHELPFPDDSFDVVTLQFASRHLRVIDVFSEIRRVLRPGGAFYHCDMLKPENPAVRRLYGMYLKGCVAGTAMMFGSGNEARSCRDYFVRAIELFYSEAELTRLLNGIGFHQVTSDSAPGGILAHHRAVKPQAV
ncbi:MAG: class I SAM-dependent methyltransferase [Hyphomicrobiales bacterium]|nr:class I SAM-dependent methyltransferase [Hyphomicrobiales bacterium]